ncbi:MAG: hypothetical protein B7Z73_14025 [Planctomycetia bacterium 21-64-5]|nr:MAG: hypothetical protein B7Z73_14025 [Planctomycetia bacterium 21-64-5]HQU45074.1 hypothetical protein [Pirellulales bacterium]
MSLEIAKIWARSAFRHPDACNDAEGLFLQAAELGVQATLTAARELTTNGQPCLARWTGAELVVLQLSPSQAESFRIRTGTLLRQIEANTPASEPAGECQLTLCDVRFDDPDPHDGRQPIKGRYRLISDDAGYIQAESAALRSYFFRPDLNGGITGYSYVESSLLPPECELTFSFNPLFLPHAPLPPQGMWVLFLQLVRAHVWGRPSEGCTALSNIAGVVVDLE